MQVFIPRRLHYAVDSEIRDVGHELLLDLPGNFILLGEAGGGKTRLTEWLGDAEAFTRCTARQLINGVPQHLLGNDGVLVIDALDEVAAKAEGDAVDLVLRALRDLNYPRFILSCRSSEWHAATMREAIREQYGEAPVETELAPLTDDDARAFLSAYLKDANRAAEVIWHFRQRGLAEWLGNPQTLGMLGDLARDESMPETASALFARYVDLAWFEHSDRRPDLPLQKLGKEAVLDALGMGFAALILTGSATLSNAPRHKVNPGDLPRAEVTMLSGGEHLEAALASRLCIGPAGRRTFQHKRIGEYLGARWLAKRADTPPKQARLLAMLRSNGIVPANLRGLHAWLATDPRLASDVIRIDPAGVIEYGDADDLPEGQGRVLLEALSALVERNPMFNAGWSPRAGSLVKGALLDDSWRILTQRTEVDGGWRYPFALRVVIARQLSGPQVVKQRCGDLRDMLLNEDQEFAIRAAAGKALAVHGGLNDWAALLEILRLQATEDACRLAVDLLDDVAFERISDRQVVELVLAYDGITISALPRETDERRTVGTLSYIEHKLPDERLDGVLDEFAAYLEPYADNHSMMIDAFDLKTLVGGLIVRRLALTDQRPLANPAALWHWLRPFQGDRGYSRLKRDEVAEWLKGHDAERRAIQRYVLFELQSDKDLGRRQWQLLEPLPGAALDSSDLATLLDGLDASDDRWRDLLTMIHHDGAKGAEARAAAKRFVANRPDMLRWIDDLATPQPREWELRDRERQLKRKAKDAVRDAEHRASFLANRDKLLTGDIGNQPAQAYLGQFSDLSKDGPPHERIGLWLGNDLQADALAGFEAFLTREPPSLTAGQIADSWAESRYWPLAWVLVAALMERMRTGKGFDDLPDERLIAAMLQIEHGLARSEEAKALGDALEAELKDRDAYEAYARLLIEPHLRERRAHISGLYGLMREKAHVGLAAKLAAEWLGNFSQMTADVEEELIDCLVRAHDKDRLRTAAAERMGDESRDERSRQNWQAVALWTDFERASGLLDGVIGRDPNLIWSIRNRLGGQRHRDEAPVALPPQLAAWIVRASRAAWPNRHHPSGVRSGDQNAWDASEYVTRLIGHLGDDPSDEATALVTELRDAANDGYTDCLRRVATEQEAKRAELAYTPPTIADIANALAGAPPATCATLQADVLAALERVQARVRSDPTDCWRGFYRDDRVTPKGEEDCSDHLANLLALEAPGIRFDPEVHVGSDREVDIACSVGNLRMPIEAKGQWNADLWTAADWQLRGQQAVDHLAAGHGIYLVYWFGAQKGRKRLQKPPAGVESPETPEALRIALGEALTAPDQQNLRMFVLDLTR
ncbi:hypothetical protein [Sphingomonas sp. RB1R13]|uniref:hypothetical protein n=1 Tax=Sphingomonas sp. RB1R13 TaxID=3096159 RepID=UPI002FCCB34E